MIANLGLSSKIIYPSVKLECPNCYRTTLPGVGSTNIYNTDGPYPFNGGLCPYCEGAGFKESSTSEMITIRTYFDKKSWNKVVPTIGIKNGDALLIGFLTDAPKLKNMKCIELASEIDGYEVRPYGLQTDITPWGIKKRRYFYCTVSRINGQG